MTEVITASASDESHSQRYSLQNMTVSL